MQSLPIDAHLARIDREIDRCGAVVVVAPPGAGKTTRVPPALIGPGPLILLQPRRVAARSLARRIAEERGWELGGEVGWQVRFERRFGPRTRLLIATEGILTRRLQDDPLLEGFSTVVLDEFHERSIHGDLALALVRQARRAREGLRVVVMSATLDATPVADYLGGCPVIEVPGRPFPVEVEWKPGVALAVAAREELRRPGRHLLCFLPGAPEIARAAREVGSVVGPEVDVLPLHGSLDSREQDRALAPTERRKLILATNLAETSLTVDGVETVIDSGLHKVMRRDAGIGIDRLETERIAADSAEQRAGRAGRTAPGRVVRLWDPRDELRARREPEISRVDLAGPFLQVLAWGEDPRRFEWFEPPPKRAADAAVELLAALGAIAGGKITDLGRELCGLPLHPRLARLLITGGGSAEAAAACAGLAERWFPDQAPGSTESDLWTIVDRIDSAPHRVHRTARQLRGLVSSRGSRGPRRRSRETDLLQAVLAAYPDRVARRREPGSPRLRLAGGHGAVLDRRSGVRNPEYLVAVDLVAGARGPGSAARVRLASGVQPEWLEPSGTEVVHRFDVERGVVRAVRRSLYDRLVLEERQATTDPEIAGRILAEEMERLDPPPATAALLRRLRFAGVDVDYGEALRRACAGRTRLPRFDLGAGLSFEQRRRLDRLAPESLALPSGRRTRLQYRDDGSVIASVKLQELFGMERSPRVGSERIPVTFSLLAPNGRPVQTTRDLESFWARTYPEVRKELRGRYPKHPWPENPRTAPATHRTRRRGPRGPDG